MSAPIKKTSRDYFVLVLITVLIGWPLPLAFAIHMGWVK